MADIRNDPTSQFANEPWLVQKENAGGVSLPESQAAGLPTAEWANNVDTSLRQINEAYQGSPVPASNVGGRTRRSVTASSTANGTATVSLISSVPEQAWVHLRVAAYARGANGEFALTEANVVLQNQDDPNNPGNMVELLDSPGDTAQGSQGDGGASVDIVGDPSAEEVNAVLSGTVDLQWNVDFEYRVLPPVAS